MSKDSLAKYYQNNKDYKKDQWKYKSHSKEEKEKKWQHGHGL